MDPNFYRSNIRVENLKLHIEEIIGGYLVQGLGKIAGYEFYFRAKLGKWSIGISIVPDLGGTEIYATSESGFYQEGEYGDNYYGDMPLDEAEQKIRQCSEQFLTWLESRAE